VITLSELEPTIDDRLTKLEQFTKANVRSIWNELDKIKPGYGELFNETYWYVQAKLKLAGGLSDREIDELSSIAAYSAICCGNIRAISRMIGKPGGRQRTRISKQIHSVRELLNA